MSIGNEPIHAKKERGFTMTKKKIAIVLCLVTLVGIFAVNGTVSYLQDSDSKTNVFKVGNVEVKLEEDEWNPEVDGNELRYPGDVKYKNPTVTAVTGDIYFRIKLELTNDEAGGDLTDSAVANLIWNTIYFEDADSIAFTEDENTGIGTTTDTLADLIANDTLANFNKAEFTATPASTAPNVKYYTYTDSTGTPKVLAEGESSILFSTIIIPADYSNDDFAAMGNYEIEITVEAIQANNIDADAAADILSDTFNSAP